MGSSVGIGALIMGVTLLSVFAVATTVISNQAEVALEVSDPDVIDKPELSISNLENSGEVTSLNIFTAGANYFPGTLDFSGSCDVLPTGTYGVSFESWSIGPFLTENSPTSGIYDGEYFSFQELNDEAGDTTNWYVWFDVDDDDADPTPGGTGIEVDITTGDSSTSIRDAALTAIGLEGTLNQISFSAGGSDTLVATYLNSGPAINVAVSNVPTGPFPVLSTNDGGTIISVNLIDGGEDCTVTPIITLSWVGVGGEVLVLSMEWDYSFEITNDGGSTVKLSEIFTTINGGETDVLSSTPAFPVEYIFPGETISVTLDENSLDTISRVAISSHGMNVAVEV